MSACATGTTLACLVRLLPDESSGSTPTYYSGDLPSSLDVTLRVEFEYGTNSSVTLKASDVYGHRLSISFNGSDKAELRLDGVVKLTGNLVYSWAHETVEIEVEHVSGEDWDHRFELDVGDMAVVYNAWGRPPMRVDRAPLPLMAEPVVEPDPEIVAPPPAPVR